jgi:hypothetical protein
MRTVLLFALIIVSTLAGSITAQTVAFQDDFDHDTPGNAPNTDPPGDPDGDYLSLISTNGIITVEESVGPISGQPLLMERTQLGDLRLSAMLDPDMWYCDSYSIRWRSAARNNVFFLGCTARSANLKLLSFLNYTQPLKLNFRGSALEVPGGYTIDVMQEFEMTLDMVAKTTSLSVDGIAIPSMQDLAQYQITGDGLQKFSVEFGGMDLIQFVVDDLEIMANCGGTPTTSVNWGAVKSLYR